ncbi:FecR domain-containing protein [Terasakiella sp. A23]|uniref:FecR family protein n=1 Tax=Terasakiella sp. FCG-A23 TaxID=3080561 RepID=UPI0029551785|nr:FecR domain-containing protein [Terasakiella sp. A23]MDV7339895.1 FecR domain-containing protein [Terasakiella sp. A23]
MKKLSFVIIACLVAISFVAQAALPDEQVAGTVKRMKGSALAVQNAQVRVLNIGDKVLIGDILSTGDESRLEITMIDDGSFQLGAKTSFVVIDYTFGKGAEDNVITELLTGALDGVSGQIAKAKPEGMKVLARTATIGIRGTKFFIGEMDDKLHVAHWSGGGVHVKNHGGEVLLDKENVGTVVHHDHVAPTEPESWHGEKSKRAKALVAH